MSYPLSILVQLGEDNSGLTLQATLINTVGVIVEGPIIAGFVELMEGDYLFSYDMPDQFQGAIIFKDDDQGDYLTAMAINPTEYENSNVLASAIQTTTTAILVSVSGATVEVRNPILTASRIELLRGDDYMLANGRQLHFTPSDPDAWPALAVGHPLVLGVGSKDGIEFQGEGTIISESPLTAEIEINGTDTISVGKGHYQFTLRTNGVTTETLAEGVLNLHDAWGGY